MHRSLARRRAGPSCWPIAVAIAVAPAMLAQRAAAQSSSTDSVSAPVAPDSARRHYIPPVHRDAWKPALALTAVTAALIPADNRILREFRRPANRRSLTLRNTADFFDQVGGAGGVQIIGPALWGLGIVTRTRGPADIGLHMTEGFAAATAAHYAMRALIGRPRPNSLDVVRADEFHLRFDWDRNVDTSPKSEEGSFPAGHALTTFAMATMMHYEIGAWAPRIATPVRIVAWTIAVGDGVSRVYRDNHWASDVMGAAAVGIFVGRTVVGVQHTHPNNVVDRVLRRITFTPSPNGALQVGVGRAW